MEDLELKKLEHTVADYERLVVRALNEAFNRKMSFGDRVADKIAAFGGSWAFIFLFAAMLTAWMVMNRLPGFPQFDPPPFILLNLVLSFIAGFQAPFIMMSQNRQEARNHMEAELDAAINFAAERRIRELQFQHLAMERDLDEIRRLVQELHAGLLGPRFDEAAGAASAARRRAPGPDPVH